jgi:anti-sigma B factor antagonist
VSDFSIVEEPRGERGIVVAARGEVEFATAPRLEAALAAAIAGCPAGGAVGADLTGVTFMDSSGLRSVLAGHRAALAAGARFAVAVDGPPVARLFELTRVADELDVVGDLAEVFGPVAG